MPADDVKGLEMVATPLDRSTLVAVEIDFGQMVQPSSYKVSIIRDGSVIAQSIVHSPVTVFHHELERDGSEYSVRVEPDKSGNVFRAKTGKLIHLTNKLF